MSFGVSFAHWIGTGGERLALDVGAGARVHEQRDDQAVQTCKLGQPSPNATQASSCAAVRTQDLGENENEDHADEQSGLLRGTTDTSITDDTNRKASGKTGETDREAGTELDEAGEERGFLAEVVGDQHADDQTVDGNDTSHDDGEDICRGYVLVDERSWLWLARPNVLLTIRSGLKTPMAEIPTPDFAVP